MSAPALDDDLDDAPSSAPRFAGWPRPFQNLATCASPLRDADGRATTHRLAVSPGGVDDGEPRAREGSGPRRAGAAGRATDDADATRADIAPWFGAGGGSALPCGRVLLAQRRSLRRHPMKKLQPTQTRGAACLMTQKSLQSRPDTLAGGYHSIRTSAPRHSSTRPRDVTKARIASDIQRSPRTKRTQPRTCVYSPARRSARRPAIPPRPFRAVQPPRPRSDGPLTDVVSTSSRRLSALNETPNVRNELR